MGRKIMTCKCLIDKAIKFVRDNDTNFNGVDFLTLDFTSTELDLSTFGCRFKLGNVVKTFDSILEPIKINYTAQETKLFPQFCNGILQLIDTEKRIATIESLIPFEAVSMVHGNAVVTEPYHLSFDVKQSGEVILNFQVKVAGEYDDTELRQLIATKQDILVSGTNIKTINNESILGSGNIDIQGGGVTQIYMGDIEPTDENILVWIDTSEEPITDNALITADGYMFITADDKNFIVA